MDQLKRLDQFDLGKDGDRHEREFWPLLSGRFPSYEILWPRLIVPLTYRIDPQIARNSDKWIRFRPDIPERYEKTAMAHYSVFYLLGRAVKRFSDEKMALEYPEDVLFLRDSVSDNFKQFLRAMGNLGADCGYRVFRGSAHQYPRGFDPFQEINDYRDTFLHSMVIGRGIGVGKTYIPKWNNEKSTSPLERAKSSWRAAEQLLPDDLISTSDLLSRLISEICLTLEKSWQEAVAVVMKQPFEQKMVSATGLSDYCRRGMLAAPLESVQPSDSFSSLGSNTFPVPFAIRKL